MVGKSFLHSFFLTYALMFPFCYIDLWLPHIIGHNNYSHDHDNDGYDSTDSGESELT